MLGVNVICWKRRWMATLDVLLLTSCVAVPSSSSLSGHNPINETGASISRSEGIIFSMMY